jgi:predicted small metal-binding protein
MTYSSNLEEVCGCSTTVEGQTKDEVVTKVKSHASTAHGMKEVPSEIAHKLMNSIKEI